MSDELETRMAALITAESGELRPPDVVAAESERRAPQEQTPEPKAEVKPEAPEAPEVPETPANVLRLKIDGADEEIPVEKAIAELQKARAADKRLKEASEKLATIDKQRQQLDQTINYFQQVAQQMMPPKPSLELLNSDPVEYLKQERVYNERLNAIAQAQTAQAHLESLRAQESTVRRSEEMKAEQQRLLKEIPHWSDEAKAAPERQKVVKHMQALGNPESRINDHLQFSAADVVAYRESMLYRELLAKAKETSKQLTKLPPKVERPGVGVTDGRTQAMQKLRQDGRIDSAAAVIRGLLD